MKVKVLVDQLCPTLCDSMDCSPPCYVQGIPQAKILQWLPFPSPGESSRLRDQTQVSGTAGGFFIIRATREAWRKKSLFNKYHWENCILNI